ncbi:MAG TPA: hypothetical protein VF495_14440 [Phenylobacterium sp.]
MRLFATMTSLAILGLATTTANAATWTSIDARQARLDDRIDAGVRTGDLTQAEAARLRSEFQGLVRLESSYRVGGLSGWERADLDRRFDGLSARIIAQRHDDQRARYANNRWVDQHGRWMSINQRQRELDRRIDAGVRTGDLTRAEADHLRATYRQIARLEARYRRGGLSTRERADLDRRFDGLAAQIRWDRSDLQYGYGYGPRG